MALCSITISGTSGSVLINYVDAGTVARTLTAGLGTLSIDDAGSDYTFTTLSGDATLTSGCISFTEVELNCYILSWELNEFNTLDNADFKFDAVEIGSTSYNMTDVNYPFCNILTLADSINSLGLDAVKATGYKIISGDKNQYFLILQAVRYSSGWPLDQRCARDLIPPAL